MELIGLIILLLFIFSFFVFFTVQFFNVAFRGFAPFISTRSKVIDEIIDNLEVGDEDVVYEFGCGKAGFLQKINKQYSKVNLIGFEYSLIPYIIGRIQNSLKGGRLKMLKKNFFKVDVKNADIIYCYLSPKSMKLLEKKFNSECKQGATVVSYEFKLPNTNPIKTLELKSTSGKVYFYKY